MTSYLPPEQQMHFLTYAGPARHALAVGACSDEARGSLTNRREYVTCPDCLEIVPEKWSTCGVQWIDSFGLFIDRLARKYNPPQK
jgi:hypothetical protein